MMMVMFVGVVGVQLSSELHWSSVAGVGAVSLGHL